MAARSPIPASVLKCRDIRPPRAWGIELTQRRPFLTLSPCGRGCLREAKAGEGFSPRRHTPHPARTSSAPPSPTRGEGKRPSNQLNVIYKHFEMSEPRPEEMVMQPRSFCADVSATHIT